MPFPCKALMPTPAQQMWRRMTPHSQLGGRAANRVERLIESEPETGWLKRNTGRRPRYDRLCWTSEPDMQDFYPLLRFKSEYFLLAVVCLCLERVQGHVCGAHSLLWPGTMTPSAVQSMQEQAVELHSSISRVHSALATAKDRQQQLHSEHTDLTQRCSRSTAARDALLSVSSLVPEQGTIPRPPVRMLATNHHCSELHQLRNPGRCGSALVAFYFVEQ